MNNKIENHRDYLLHDVFALLEERTSSRPMFGGVGLYLDGRIFGLIVSDHEVYLKVGDNNRQDFLDAGSEPFTYYGHKDKKPTVMPYWQLPDEIIEDRQMAAEWAEKAAENSVVKD